MGVTIRVHGPDDDLPTEDDIVWQYGAGGIALSSKRTGGTILCENPVELGTNR